MSPLHFLHEPPQSTPVSSPFIVPSVHDTHIPLKQVCPAPAHPLSFTHSTHVPLPSHCLLPSHVVPAVANFFSGMPLLQLSMVHMLPSSGGVSLSSLTVIVPPIPSQTSVLQSPLVGSLTGVPCCLNV